MEKHSINITTSLGIYKILKNSFSCYDGVAVSVKQEYLQKTELKAWTTAHF